MTIDVVIADDHPIFRRGLRDVIDGHDRFRVVAAVGDGEAALTALREHRPAIAVLDISMPKLDGFEVLTQSRTWADPPAVVMLTMYDDYADRAMEAGARGYLLKENAEQQLIACLEAVADGERYVSDGIDWRPDTRTVAPGPIAALTQTERRVLRLLSQFKTSREIGEILCVSHRTVQNHRANMCAKLQLVGSKALLQFAIANKDAL